MIRKNPLLPYQMAHTPYYADNRIRALERRQADPGTVLERVWLSSDECIRYSIRRNRPGGQYGWRLRLREGPGRVDGREVSHPQGEERLFLGGSLHQVLERGADAMGRSLIPNLDRARRRLSERDHADGSVLMHFPKSLLKQIKEAGIAQGLTTTEFCRAWILAYFDEPVSDSDPKAA